MEKRLFGRTGHASTVAILGAAAFGQVTQAETDECMEKAMEYGVNHIDVAPSYGEAELRLGPWMEKKRHEFFLGCKTTERTKDGAALELRKSLARLRVDHFDLYQFHAITTMSELNEIFAPNGAMEAVQEAKKAGLLSYIGITGHGFDSPAIFIEALHRFDFDSVLFPINFIQYADPLFRKYAEKLLTMCQERNVGVMIIKAITRGPWGDKPHTHHTWYEPFDDLVSVQKGVNFALSQNITGICTAGSTKVLSMVLEACNKFSRMNQESQEHLIKEAKEYQPLFSL